MDIRKIGNLSEEESKILTEAGQLAGAIKRALESGEITEISEDSKNLLSAVCKVLLEVTSK